MTMKTILCALFLFAFALALPSYAQESTAEPTPEVTAEIAAAPGLMPELMPELTPGLTPAPTLLPTLAPLTLSFTDLGYGRLNLSGMFGAASLYVPFQPAWEFDTPAQLTIRYQTSPLLTEISSLSLLINQTPISSIPLHPSEGVQTFTVTVPVDLLQGTGFTLNFEGYLRVTDQECESYGIPGQWVNILPESTISLTPTLTTTTPNLSDIGSTFFATDIRKKPIPTLLVMPDHASADLLNASAQILKGLAKLSNPTDFKLSVAAAGAVSTDELAAANVILLGLPDQQPLLPQLGAPIADHLRAGKFITDDRQPVPDEHAVLAVVQSPWNPERDVLVLSANGSAGLTLLGTLFSDQHTLQNLSGGYTFAAAPLEPLIGQADDPWTTSTTTFAQLGQYDRTQNGLGVFDQYYTFYRPAGWVFEAGSTLTLSLAVSPAVAANPGSYVAAFINEIPLGSYTLDQLSPDGQLTFKLPPEINQGASGELPQVINLRIQVSNQYQQGYCQEIDRAIGWTTISSDSSLTTMHSYRATPDLQVFPYPFVSDAPQAPVTIVLPPQPQPDDLAAALRLTVLLGLFAPAPFDLNVITSDQLAAGHLKDNLIVLGERSRQPLIDQLLDKNALAQTEQLYTELNGATRGILYTAVSPNDPQRTILLAFGASSSGAAAALDALLTLPPPPLNRSGTLALVDAGAPLRVVVGAAAASTSAAGVAPTPTLTPTSTPPAQTTSDSSLPSFSWIIIVAPMALAIFLIVLVWAVQKLRKHE